MPDHAHLLLQPLIKSHGIWYDLAEIMKGIKGVSARRINPLLGTQGFVWQHESFDRNVRDERELNSAWNYILSNPIKSGLVENCDDFPFYVFGRDASS